MQAEVVSLQVDFSVYAEDRAAPSLERLGGQADDGTVTAARIISPSDAWEAAFLHCDPDGARSAVGRLALVAGNNTIIVSTMGPSPHSTRYKIMVILHRQGREITSAIFDLPDKATGSEGPVGTLAVQVQAVP